MKSKAALSKLALAVVEFQRRRPLAASVLFAAAAEDESVVAELERLTGSSDVGVAPSDIGEVLRELPEENPGGREVQAAGEDERVEVKGSGDDERVEVKAGANGWTFTKSDPAFSGEATLSCPQGDKEFYVAFAPKDNESEADSLEVGYYLASDPTDRSDDSWEHVNADDKVTDEDIKKAEELLKKFGCSAMPDRFSWNSLIGRLEMSSKRPSLFKATGEDERVEVKAGTNSWNFTKSDPALSGAPSLCYTDTKSKTEFYIALVEEEQGHAGLEIGATTESDHEAGGEPSNYGNVDVKEGETKVSDEEVKKAEEMLKKFGCPSVPSRSNWNSLLSRLELSKTRPSLRTKASGDEERVEVESEFRDEIDPLDEMASNCDEMPTREEASVRARNRLARSLANIQAMARRTTAAKK